MKKSLLALALCLAAPSLYAQDDDIYFVPSSKDKTSEVETPTAPGRSTYTPITGEDATFTQSHWASGRSNGGRDVDEYNRRGKNYKQSVADTLSSQESYDEGYSDGYEDGMYTSRLVRFRSPSVGVYVSSPYYLDYFDIAYDPWYYGYGAGWGWSGWYGWGSWYGWRPYYSSWYWGWNSPWYDPWYWGPHYGWHHHHHHHWHDAVPYTGRYVSYGGVRGGRDYATSTTGRTGFGSGRPSSSLGFNGRGQSGRGNYTTSGTRPGRQFGTGSRPSSSFGTFNRSDRGSSTSTRPSQSGRSTRQFGNRSSKSSSRSYRRESNDSYRSSRSYSSPSRSSGSYNRGSSSSFRSSGSFGGGSRGGGSFGGGGGRGRR